jgi:hypothetical protein
MRKNLFLILLFISYNSFIYSQNRVSINVGLGYYLLNPENSNKVVGDKRFKWYLQFGLAYQRDDILGSSFIFEYSYNRSTKEDALIFVRTSEIGPEPIGYFGADVSLINHNFDIDYVRNINNLIVFGAGPSFVITNRIVETGNLLIGEEGSVSLYDKLASSGIGLNTFLNFSIPFSESEHYFFFTSNIKLRYTHSIWFDEGNRKLDDYSQDFFTTDLSVGIGYSF